MDTKYLCAGIDLGTCFSCVYVYKNGSFVPVPIDGNVTVPSYISYTNGQFHFGRSAKQQASRYPENTFYDVKRIIGRHMRECEQLIRYSGYPFMLVANEQDIPQYYCEVNDGCYNMLYPEQVDALFLQYLIANASAFMDGTIRDVVITVPAYFEQAQMNATYTAAAGAGLNVLRMLYEPSAAALASNYVSPQLLTHLLVYDLGGGTFDVALMKVLMNEYSVIANDGHPCLGGQDFDNEMISILLEKLSEKGVNTKRLTKRQLARLRQEAEEVKMNLTKNEDWELDISDYVDLEGDDSEMDEIVITRSEFEDRIERYIDETIRICERCIGYSELRSLGENDKILLVGGSSVIPLVKRKLEERFGKGRVIQNVEPNRVVANGACVSALPSYCSRYGIVCPIELPKVHSIVVREVSVQFNNEDEVVVMPTGTPCGEWKMISYTPRLFQPRVCIRVYSKGINEKTLLGSMNEISFHSIVFSMMMNAKGELEYNYGKDKKSMKHGVVPLQSGISCNEVNDYIKKRDEMMKCVNTLESYKGLINQSGNRQLIETVKKALEFFEKNGWERVPLNDIVRYSQQVLLYVKQVLRISIVSSISNHTFLLIHSRVHSIVLRFLSSIQRIQPYFLSISFVAFLHGNIHCNMTESSSPSSLSSSSHSISLHLSHSNTNRFDSSQSHYVQSIQQTLTLTLLSLFYHSVQPFVFLSPTPFNSNSIHTVTSNFDNASKRTNASSYNRSYEGIGGFASISNRMK